MIITVNLVGGVIVNFVGGVTVTSVAGVTLASVGRVTVTPVGRVTITPVGRVTVTPVGRVTVTPVGGVTTVVSVGGVTVAFLRGVTGALVRWSCCNLCRRSFSYRLNMKGIVCPIHIFMFRCGIRRLDTPFYVPRKFLGVLDSSYIWTYIIYVMLDKFLLILSHSVKHRLSKPQIYLN